MFKNAHIEEPISPLGYLRQDPRPVNCRGGNVMHHTAFATHLVSPLKQFDAWQSWYAPEFDTGQRQPQAEGFRAKTKVWTLDGFMFSRAGTPPVSATRTKALIRRNPVDHWCIGLSKETATSFEAEDKSGSFRQGCLSYFR
jgi:hypothetical protein